MSLLSVVLVLVVVGLLLWVLNNSTWIPLDPKIRLIINVVVIIAVIVWLLRAFGVWDAMAGVRF